LRTSGILYPKQTNYESVKNGLSYIFYFKLNYSCAFDLKLRVEFRPDYFPTLNSITDMENQIRNPLNYYISACQENYDFIKMGKTTNALSPEFSGMVF